MKHDNYNTNICDGNTKTCISVTFNIQQAGTISPGQIWSQENCPTFVECNTSLIPCSSDSYTCAIHWFINMCIHFSPLVLSSSLAWSSPWSPCPRLFLQLSVLLRCLSTFLLLTVASQMFGHFSFLDCCFSSYQSCFILEIIPCVVCIYSCHDADSDVYWLFKVACLLRWSDNIDINILRW